MSRAPTIWEEGRAPGHRVVALAVALTLTVAAVDLLVTDRIGVLFDVGFVVVCVAMALAVHPRDMFPVGVLPPLLMLGLFLLLALTRTEALTDASDHAVQAVVSGLGHHSVGLFAAYALTLAVLGVRRRVLAQRAASGHERRGVARPLAGHDRLGA